MIQFEVLWGYLLVIKKEKEYFGSAGN